MDPELELAQKCGFKNFDEIYDRIQAMVAISKEGKTKTEKSLEIYQALAKEYLKLGEKGKAKDQLIKKKNHLLRLNNLEPYFNLILNKNEVTENIEQMSELLDSIKYVCNVLLYELDTKITGIETNENKEYQELVKIDREVMNYLEIMAGFVKESEIKKLNIQKDIYDLLEKCGFDSIEDARDKISELTSTMQVARVKIKKNMERFQIQAKKFLVKGQNEDAKNELKKEMEKELIIQKYDTQICAFSKIFDMSEKVIQFLEAFDVLKACNDILLAELEEGEGVAQSKEYQELKNIDKLITNYIDILNSFEGAKN